MRRFRVALVTLIAVFMAAIRTAIVVFYMEKNEIANETYYLPDRFIINAFCAVSIILVLAFVVAAYLDGRKKTVELCSTSDAAPCGALVLGFALLFAGYSYTNSTLLSDAPSYTVIGLIILAFTALSMIRFFFLGLASGAEKRAGLQSLLALFPLFLAVFRLLGDFIRRSAAPFASSGAYLILGLVAVMLFFLFEGKSYVLPVSSAVYSFCGYCALFFLLVYSVPNLVLHCFGVLPFDYYTAYSVVDIGTAVYIVARLASAKQIVTEE